MLRFYSVFLLIILTGSSGDTIVSHFAVNYHNEAQQLGIDLNELYSALVTDGEFNPLSGILRDVKSMYTSKV
jgi:hypothetical protein